MLLKSHGYISTKDILYRVQFLLEIDLLPCSWILRCVRPALRTENLEPEILIFFCIINQWNRVKGTCKMILSYLAFFVFKFSAIAILESFVTNAIWLLLWTTIAPLWFRSSINNVYQEEWGLRGCACESYCQILA